jgi:hypothetical protein
VNNLGTQVTWTLGPSSSAMISEGQGAVLDLHRSKEKGEKLIEFQTFSGQ